MTESKEVNGSKSSAESHATIRSSSAERAKESLTQGITAEDKEVDEVTDMFADLAKKVGVHG